VFVSPVFATISHPDAAALGVAAFARLARETTMPVYGLGGITDENAEQLAGSGAAGLAAIGGLL
jgi:thiamine monophosphate synthase